MGGKFNLFLKEKTSKKIPFKSSGSGSPPQKDFLIQKAYQEPDRSVVQADDAVQVVRRMAVVPRTHIFLFQERSAHIFTQKDAGHVDKPPPE